MVSYEMTYASRYTIDKHTNIANVYVLFFNVPSDDYLFILLE